MKKMTLIMVATTAIICIVALIFSGYIGQKEGIPNKEDLVLSSYPKLFEKDVVIVIGENASRMEYESAEAIAENLHNITGNMPVIKSDTELTEDDKARYNLILVGGPTVNSALREAYDITNATKVTKEYPGGNKGVLEILSNPWNKDKALLIVAGSNEWGTMGASKMLTEEKIEELRGEMMVTKWTEESHIKPSEIITAQTSNDNLVLQSMLENKTFNVSETIPIQLKLKNTLNQKVKFFFTSSKQFDFIIYDDSGAKVYQWSNDKNFIQVIINIVLEPNESIDMSLEWVPTKSGNYSLVAQSVFFHRRRWRSS